MVYRYYVLYPFSYVVVCSVVVKYKTYEINGQDQSSKYFQTAKSQVLDSIKPGELKFVKLD